jgi:hypothetical protein
LIHSSTQAPLSQHGDITCGKGYQFRYCNWRLQDRLQE